MQGQAFDQLPSGHRHGFRTPGIIDDIGFGDLDGEPFRKLIDAWIVKRQVHVDLVPWLVEEEFAVPRLIGGEADEQLAALAHGTEADIRAPGFDMAALRFPQRVHQRGAGKVAVAMPAFDNPVGLLLAPHGLDFGVDPFRRRGNRFAVDQRDRSFDGIGIAICR